MIPSDIKIFCGLYLPALTEEESLTKAMEAAMRGGADGISFFSYEALTNEMKKQIKRFIAEH